MDQNTNLAEAVFDKVIQKEYTGNAGKLLHWLKQGLNMSQAAAAVGVDRTLANQLMREPEFAAQVEAALSEKTQKAVTLAQNYEDIEQEVVKSVKENLWQVTSLDDKLKVLRTVALTKPKISPQDVVAAGNTNIQNVTLVLPKVIYQNFVVNPNSEIVQIEGQQLNTLNSASLNGLLAKKLPKPETVIIDDPPNGNKQLKDKWSNL